MVLTWEKKSSEGGSKSRRSTFVFTKIHLNFWNDSSLPVSLKINKLKISKKKNNKTWLPLACPWKKQPNFKKATSCSDTCCTPRSPLHQRRKEKMQQQKHTTCSPLLSCTFFPEPSAACVWYNQKTRRVGKISYAPSRRRHTSWVYKHRTPCRGYFSGIEISTVFFIKS